MLTALKQSLSAPVVTHTSATAIIGLAGASAMPAPQTHFTATVSDWLQIAILAGTAMTIFVRAGWELKKFFRPKTKTKRKHQPPLEH